MSNLVNRYDYIKKNLGILIRFCYFSNLLIFKKFKIEIQIK